MNGPGCSVFVGGYGRPGQRDLDLGRQLVSYLQQFEWPEGVLIEDTSYAAPMVLHRLQEVLPGKVLLLGAVRRGVDPPGSIRRYGVDVRPPGPEEVQRRLEESVQGMVDLDHTLAVARHWGGLPADTVVVEVEPADCSFGVGFSDEMAEVFDTVVATVREEVGDAEDRPLPLVLDPPAMSTPSVAGGLGEMAEYAARHEEARLVNARRAPTSAAKEVLGLASAGRCLPWTPGVGSGSDWCEVFPLDDRRLAVVAGDVPGRGVEAVATMNELRAAVRAYAAIDGPSPARVLEHLDRFVDGGDLAGSATLVYIVVNSLTGEVCLGNAGHCPPLLAGPDRKTIRFLRDGRSDALGTAPKGDRVEAIVQPPDEATLIVFSDGLVTSRTRSMPDGLEVLLQATRSGPNEVADLCDHLLTTCLAGTRRDDDVSLLAVDLPSADRARPRTSISPAPVHLLP